MANQIIEYGIKDEVLKSVCALTAHCFELVPLAFGQPPNSLIVATPYELNDVGDCHCREPLRKFWSMLRMKRIN